VSFLLDTNVVLEIRKQAPDAGVAEWFASVPADGLFLSVLVVAEIRQGIERLARRDPDQAEIFERWLRQLVGGYSDRLVPITERIAQAWAVSMSQTRCRSMTASWQPLRWSMTGSWSRATLTMSGQPGSVC